MKVIEIKKVPGCGDILDAMKVGDVIIMRPGASYNALHNARTSRRKKGHEWNFEYNKLNGEMTITRIS